MSFKVLLRLHGVVYLVFAIALFFIPETLWPIYGVEIKSPDAKFLSQHNSIFLGGIAIFAFLLQGADLSANAARRVVGSLFWTDVLGVVVTLYACFTGAFSGLGWSDPAFFALMAGSCLWHQKACRVSSSESESQSS